MAILRGLGARGVANNGFDAPTLFSAGPRPIWVTATDLNRDRILGLVVPNSSGNNLSILLGNGSDGVADGTFADPDPHVVVRGTRCVVADDLNGDGNIDFAVAAWEDDHLSVYPGLGAGGVWDGRIGPPTVYPTSGGPWQVIAEDFNGDGVLDLAATNFRGNGVSIPIGESVAMAAAGWETGPSASQSSSRSRSGPLV